MPLPASPSQDAQAIAEEFRKFTYIVSHDLNTHLRVMVEFSRMLMTEKVDALDEEGKQYLSLIVEHGERMHNMLAGLLDYSRLSTTTKAPASVDCNAVLNHCNIALQDKIKSRKATLTASPLPTVVMDADHCIHLFLALLDNALKFQKADAAPVIKISAEKQAHEWLFTVQDNGIGIEPRFYDRIFEIFQRLHSDQEYPGMGLGLALAKKIVERQGGKIWACSMPTGGTAFQFTVPEPDVA
jgi:two-component system, sensor histidine kinase and response regulator